MPPVLRGTDILWLFPPFSAKSKTAALANLCMFYLWLPLGGQGEHLSSAHAFTKSDITPNSHFLFGPCFCYRFSLHLLAVAVCAAVILNACRVLVWFLSTKVKNHEVPLGHNYPASHYYCGSTTIIPRGKGPLSPHNTPRSPWVMDLWYPCLHMEPCGTYT